MLPTLRPQVLSESSIAPWHALLCAVPSAITLQTILVSLCSHLDLASVASHALDGSLHIRARVKREALLLREVCGAAAKDNEILEAVLGAIVGKQWDIAHARTFVCWSSGLAEKKDMKGASTATFGGRVADECS